MITSYNEWGEGTQIVKAIKSKLDEKYGPSWHVIQGKNFGSYVTNEQKHYIYFYQGQTAVLLFKTN